VTRNEITTDRLHLAPVSQSDFEDLCALWHDEGFTRYISGRSLSEEEVWTRLLRDVGHWQVMGFGNWAIRLNATGAYVGSVGLFDFRRALVPAFESTEVGWGLSSAYHGQGLANEALGAALQWADQHMQTDRTVCMISAENKPSVKLALQHAFRPYGQGAYNGSVVDLYERLMPAC